MDGKEKVILVSPLPPPIGGISSWTIEVMNRMPLLGCEVLLVNSGIVGKRAEDVSKVNMLDEIRRAFAIRKKIKAFLKTEDTRVVHYNASCFTMGLIRDTLILYSLRKKADIFYHCHCNLDTNVNNAVAEFFFKTICHISKKILPLNEKSLSFAQKYTDKAFIIPNFIEKVYADDVKVREEVKDIVFVGRVTEDKGILELLEASKGMDDVNIHIIGPDENNIIENCKAENIIYEGPKFHDEVLERLKDMDALILPSYSEGFPLVVLEAMAYGLPIISTPVGSVPDMIGEEGGILIKLKDSASIIEAVEEIKPYEKRHKMAQYNLDKVKREYLSETVLKKLLEIYREA